MRLLNLGSSLAGSISHWWCMFSCLFSLLCVDACNHVDLHFDRLWQSRIQCAQSVRSSNLIWFSQAEEAAAKSTLNGEKQAGISAMHVWLCEISMALSNCPQSLRVLLRLSLKLWREHIYLDLWFSSTNLDRWYSICICSVLILPCGPPIEIVHQAWLRWTRSSCVSACGWPHDHLRRDPQGLAGHCKQSWKRLLAL
jgi:hypothetical protein